MVNMTFKEELRLLFIPGHTYRRVGNLSDSGDLVFTHFQPPRKCSISCHGEIGKCDGTRLNFKNYEFIVCPYSDNNIRFKRVLKPEKSNTRW